jgi:hypothetical protein
MKAGTKYVLWTNAFPPFESRMHLTREWLYAAAKERKAKIIKMRVKEDDGFVRGLKHLVFSFPQPFCIIMTPVFVVDLRSRRHNPFGS